MKEQENPYINKIKKTGVGEKLGQHGLGRKPLLGL